VVPTTSRSTSSIMSHEQTSRLIRHLRSLRRANLDKHGVAEASSCIQHNAASQRLHLPSYQSQGHVAARVAGHAEGCRAQPGL